MVAATVQPITMNASVPVLSLNPPPEGPMAASATFVFNSNPAIFQLAQFFQLGSQAGLLMSQVVMLGIDNSQSPYPLQVIHGALNEVITVPPGTQVIVPTVSSRGQYSINMSLITTSLMANVTVNVIFLNYERQASSFPSAGKNTMANGGQPSGTIYANTETVTANGTQLLFTGTYLFDSLTFGVDWFKPTAAGAFAAELVLTPPPPPQESGPIAQITLAGVATTGQAGEYVPGATYLSPEYRSWSQGLQCLWKPSDSLNIQTVGLTNLTAIGVRVNISGVQLA